MALQLDKLRKYLGGVKTKRNETNGDLVEFPRLLFFSRMKEPILDDLLGNLFTGKTALRGLA